MFPIVVFITSDNSEKKLLLSLIIFPDSSLQRSSKHNQNISIGAREGDQRFSSHVIRFGRSLQLYTQCSSSSTVGKGLPITKAPGCLDERLNTQAGAVQSLGNHLSSTCVVLVVRVHLSHWIPHSCTADSSQEEQCIKHVFKCLSTQIILTLILYYIMLIVQTALTTIM